MHLPDMTSSLFPVADRDFDYLDTYSPRIWVPLNEPPFPYISISSRSKFLLAHLRKSLRDYVGFVEHPPFATNGPRTMQGFLKQPWA